MSGEVNETKARQIVEQSEESKDSDSPILKEKILMLNKLNSCNRKKT